MVKKSVDYKLILLVILALIGVCILMGNLGCMLACPSGQALNEENQCVNIEPKDIYCPEDPMSGSCTKGDFTKGNVNCGCTGSSMLCDLPFVLNDPPDEREKCGSGTDWSGSLDKCCAGVKGTNSDKREIFHDCAENSDPSPGEGGPAECWYQLDEPYCGSFTRVGSSPSCKTTDRIGICNAPCTNAGGRCKLGRNECCTNGCWAGEKQDPTGKVIESYNYIFPDLQCYPDPDSYVPEYGVCDDCPQGQIKCGTTCYTPSATESCCGLIYAGEVYNPQTEGCCGTGANAEKYDRKTESCCGTGDNARKYAYQSAITERTNCCINGQVTSICGIHIECCLITTSTSDGGTGQYTQCIPDTKVCAPTNTDPAIVEDPCASVPISQCSSTEKEYCVMREDAPSGFMVGRNCGDPNNCPDEYCRLTTISCGIEYKKCQI